MHLVRCVLYARSTVDVFATPLLLLAPQTVLKSMVLWAPGIDKEHGGVYVGCGCDWLPRSADLTSPCLLLTQVADYVSDSTDAFSKGRRAGTGVAVGLPV